MTNKREPMSDLGQHIFDMAVGMNRVYAAGLGIDLPGHHAQVERMQANLDNPLKGDFERSVPSLPEGKAACERPSCERIVAEDEVCEHGYCNRCWNEHCDTCIAEREGLV